MGSIERVNQLLILFDVLIFLSNNVAPYPRIPAAYPICLDISLSVISGMDEIK